MSGTIYNTSETITLGSGSTDTTAIEADITTIENDITTLDTSVTNVITAIGVLNTDITDLTADVVQNTSTIGDIQVDLTDAQAEVNNNSTAILTNTNSLASLSSTVSTVETDTNTNTTDIVTLNNNQLDIDSRLDIDHTKNMIYLPSSLETLSNNASSASSVLIGNNLNDSSSNSTFVDSVVIGRGATSFNTDSVINTVLVGTGAGSFSNLRQQSSVGIGHNANIQGGNRNTIIGSSTGCQNFTPVDSITCIGFGASDSVQEYDGSGSTGLNEYDVLIHAGPEVPGLSKPLIRASADQLAPHWSPGLPAQLGLDTQKWTNLLMTGTIGKTNENIERIFTDAIVLGPDGLECSTNNVVIGIVNNVNIINVNTVNLGSGVTIDSNGINNAYAHLATSRWTSQGSFPDRTSQLMDCNVVDSPDPLGHITQVGGTNYRNTSGRDAVWRCEATSILTTPVLYTEMAFVTGSAFITTANPATLNGTNRLGHIANEFDPGVAADGTQPYIQSTSITFRVPAGHYVACYVYGDADGPGNPWSMGFDQTFRMRITITECA